MRRFVVEIYELSNDGERKTTTPLGYFECDESDLIDTKGENAIKAELVAELYTIVGVKS